MQHATVYLSSYICTQYTFMYVFVTIYQLTTLTNSVKKKKKNAEYERICFLRLCGCPHKNLRPIYFFSVSRPDIPISFYWFLFDMLRRKAQTIYRLPFLHFLQYTFRNRVYICVYRLVSFERNKEMKENRNEARKITIYIFMRL